MKEKVRNFFAGLKKPKKEEGKEEENETAELLKEAVPVVAK